MKHIFLLIFFVGVSAEACLSLAGKYSCVYKGEEGAFELIISQRSADGVITYMVGKDEYVADQAIHLLPDYGDDVILVTNRTYKASCSAKKFDVVETSLLRDIYMDPPYDFATTRTASSFRLKKTTLIIDVIDEWAFVGGGGSDKDKYRVVCTPH